MSKIEIFAAGRPVGMRTRAPSLVLAVGLALMTGGCLGERMQQEASPDVTNAPVGAGLNMPSGGNEDFIVNVGRRTYFREGSAELDSTAKVTLDHQAAWLAQYPRWKVKIQGFADDPGSPEQNTALSLKRADSVRNYLAGQGVAANRMRVKAYGRDRIVRDCADISCKSQNRRVITNLEGDEDV